MKRTLLYVGIILAVIIGSSAAIYQSPVMAQVDGFFNSISVSTGGTLNGTFGGTATFINPLSASITGNAGTATALATTPTQCGGSTPLASGIAANGNANCTTAGGAFVQGASVAGCTTGSSSYDTCSVTVAFPVAFADTNYNVGCTGKGPSDARATINGYTIVDSQHVSVLTVTEGSVAVSFSAITCVGVHN